MDNDSRIYCRLENDSYEEFEAYREERDISTSDATRRLLRAGLDAEKGEDDLTPILGALFGGLVSMTLAFGALTVGVYLSILVVLVGVLGLALGYAVFDVLEGEDAALSALRFWRRETA